MRYLQSSCALECASRSIEQATILTQQKLQRGIRSLRVMACLAPHLGLFGTILATVAWLSTPTACFGPIRDLYGLAAVFLVLLISLPIAAFIHLGHYYCQRQAEALTASLRIQSLQIINILAHFRHAPPEADTTA